MSASRRSQQRSVSGGFRFVEIFPLATPNRVGPLGRLRGLSSIEARLVYDGHVLLTARGRHTMTPLFIVIQAASDLPEEVVRGKLHSALLINSAGIDRRRGLPQD